MKTNRVFRGLNIFFCSIGVLFITGLIILLISNFAAVSTFASIVGLVKYNSLFPISSGQMITGAGSGIVDALKDPYSKYLDKTTWKDLKERIEAKFGGIGVYILQDEAGRLKIVSPIEGTPAYREGLKNGDIILKINGETAVNMTSDNAAQLMRGDPGTQLVLSIFRESDKKDYEFKITREIINVPSVRSEAVKNHPEIGYVRLNQFSSQSDKEMVDSLNNLISDKKIRGLILDLRNNGGGDFEAAVSIAAVFLEDKDVVSSVDADGNKEVRRAESSGGSFKLPMVVLVNKDSASASEILAGALHDNNRALLVGEKTYGKGLVQTVFPLPDGGALKLTTQKYFTPQGTDINQIGIMPDFKVENDSASDKDRQLERAVEVMTQQLSKGTVNT